MTFLLFSLQNVGGILTPGMNAVMDFKAWPRHHRLTAEEYHRMGEMGLLAPDARVELIEGVIIEMPPIGSRHSGMVRRLNHQLVQAVGDRAMVSVQLPVRLGRWSEPQPDFVLLKPRDDFYSRKHPSGLDTLLAIEISDSTVRYDIKVKIPLYASHDIPEVWIVDLRKSVLRTYRQLQEGRYIDQAVVERPGVMNVVALPGVSFDLTGLFA